MRIFALLIVPCCLLSGCAFGPTAPPSPALPSTGLAISGVVHGGRQPVIGAHLYLFAANTTGYGSASVSLLTSVPGNTTLDTGGGATNGDYYATSNSSGSFSITGDYTCTAGQQVYLYATGGDAGSGNNSAASLMAAFGSCPSGNTFATATPFVVINEVTTIAAAYAIAYFASDATHISGPSDSASQIAIANAFGRATLLANISTGQALTTTPNGNGIVPQAMINTQANILAACVNSTGPSSSSCSTLFANSYSDPPSVQPAETSTAAINIAQNPGTNVSLLYALSTASPPFAPALSTQPNDFSFGIAYTAPGLTTAQGLAADAYGNFWVANPTANSITRFSPLGVPTTFTGNGLNKPVSIAVTSNNNVFVANSGTTGGVSGFTNAGVPLTNSPFTGGGVSAPTFIINDLSDNVWTINGTTGISELSSTGAAVSPSTGFTFFLPHPTALNSIAIDTYGNAWASDSNATNLYYFLISPAFFGLYAYPLSNFSGAANAVGDISGNVWFTNSGNNYLDQVSNGESFSSGSAGGSSSSNVGTVGGAVATGGPVAPALRALGATPAQTRIKLIFSNAPENVCVNVPLHATPSQTNSNTTTFCPTTSPSVTTGTAPPLVEDGWGNVITIGQKDDVAETIISFLAGRPFGAFH